MDKNSVTQLVEASIKIAAIFILASWCYQILNPFVTPIIWAAIFAVALKPVCDWVEGKLGGKRKLAAIMVTLGILGLVITPIVLLGEGIIDNSMVFAATLEAQGFELRPPAESMRTWPLLGEQAYQFWSQAVQDIPSTVEHFRPEIAEFSKSFALKAAGVGGSMLLMILSIIIAGVFLAAADGSSGFAHRLARRLAGETGEKFASLASVTVRNVTQGILGVALLQAVLAAIGFAIIGLPAVPLLALLVLIMSIIQLNPILLLLPLAIYVYSFASPVVATIYLIWSIAVGLMDNVLKPMIMGKGSPVPMMVVFLGAIGGFMTTGFVGLFIGAVIVALGYELFMAWLKAGEIQAGQGDSVETVSESK